ncbi:MAG: M48 family metalloprotease [Patescibacteria group bacterium]
MSAYTYQSKNVRKTWLLIFLFVGLVSAVFYVIGAVNNTPIFAVIGLVISLVQALIAYYTGDKIALTVARAKEVSPQKAPEIHNLVENLSKVADIPKPKVHISPDPSANAFACGRDPEHASICLNQGILNLLDKNELEGVIAHELAHIKNRDILVMTVTMVLASVISFIADIGFRTLFWGGGRSSRDSDDMKSPFILVIYVVTLILAPIVATLIQFAVSRSRESLADATAVVFTRYPKGLMSALEKLYKNPTPTNHYSTAMNHFYIAPPKKSFGQKVSGWFSSHPPIEERIQKLKNLS